MNFRVRSVSESEVSVRRNKYVALSLVNIQVCGLFEAEHLGCNSIISMGAAGANGKKDEA